MEKHEKDQFLKMLAMAMGAYSKPLPEAGIINAWFETLKSYPLNVIGMAFAAYCDENGEFAPVPAGIVKRCKLMDGRPTDEEAWAIALTSRNEEDTVVWTEETAEAFGICSPILALGDEVGARMAFKDTYNRLVGAARMAGKPAVWNASLGWDAKKREGALVKASIAGLLPAPVVAGLLPPPVGEVPQDANARSQLDKIRQMMATMNAEKSREAELHAQRERDATAEAKRLANEKVALYQVGKAA